MLYLCLLLFLSSCYLGPKNSTPDMTLPLHYEHTTLLQEEEGQSSIDLTTWWTQFNDPLLEALIQQAAQKNFSIRSAVETIAQSRASLAISRSKLFPILDAFLGGAKTKLPRDQIASLVPLPPGAPPLDLLRNFFAVGLDASWELDFFGKNLSAKRSAFYSLKATEEQAKYTKIVVIAEIASLYTHIRSVQQQLLLIQRRIDLEKKLLDLANNLESAGLDSDFSVETAAASLYSKQSLLPNLKQELEQSYQTLSLLLGGPIEEELEEAIKRPGKIPLAFGKVPLGLPSDLLQRRPDILEAEFNLYAAGASIGEAKAGLFPSFALTGLLGDSNPQFPHLIRPTSQFWLLIPTINWSLFQGGKVLANIQKATSAQKIASIAYEETVTSALKEVEKALIGYSCQTLRTYDVVMECKTKKKLVELAKTLLSSGLSPTSELLQRYEELFTAEMECVEVKEEAMNNLILLYKALGGGWESFN